eukprot:gnl/MRDRNA2_/MRDRNA2_96157_c0_seq1.p1 gnl/MRDRNA2_/MRDRNA2_96157_c0~~gnl/MRDRNA2_/MRDRNA2_96157_c0_seq1.p1  ORF type:complete len:269 (+),score=61.13 gnl/MRDRNA2_/MRDRNA2_96157_c0_seq1:76-882(+)
MTSEERSSSRSPRGNPVSVQDGMNDDLDEDPERSGKELGKQIKQTRTFLEYALKQQSMEGTGGVSKSGAGLPLEAAGAILPLGAREALRGLPADLACVAAAARVLGELVPDKVAPDAFAQCAAAACTARSMGNPQENVGISIERVTEEAAAFGIQTRVVSSAQESLVTMTRGEAVVSLIVLEDYVAVHEDAETGEEAEEEVGSHCVVVLGGDLAAGPSFVVFDPHHSGTKSVSFWSSIELSNAHPKAIIELLPGAAKDMMDADLNTMS